MSTHINAADKGDIAESILLPGDPLRARYIAENFLEEPVLYTDVRNMYGYTGRYKGCPVSVQGTGMGMPSMGIYSHELIHEYGVENLIRVGTCGAFQDCINMGDVILSLAASTDSNYVHTFGLPGTYAPSASWELLQKTMECNKHVRIPITGGNTVSCDVFYEFDPEWWKKWASIGVLAVEMEAAALYMEAAAAGRNAIAMMTVTDMFPTGEKATTEERKKASPRMITLALEVAVS